MSENSGVHRHQFVGGTFLDFKIPAVEVVGWGWPGSMVCLPGSWRLHVRPKLDSGWKMYVIVVHLTMFASVKHFPATVHFEAGHCKRQEPGKQTIDPGQPQLQDSGAVGILKSKNGLLAVAVRWALLLVGGLDL